MKRDELILLLERRLGNNYSERELYWVQRALWEDVLKANTKHVECLDVLIDRLSKGEPIQYVTGVAHFYGLTIHVTPDVLIPRPETEELVYWILEDFDSKQEKAILDLGTGSGCIALAVKSKRPGWYVRATDVSVKALKVAHKNASGNNVKVQFSHLDMLVDADWNALDRKFDLIVSNPPYIPKRDARFMDDRVKKHEPELALFVPDEDPLVFYKRILENGRRVLNPNGVFYFEIHQNLGDRLKTLAMNMGFQEVTVKQDLQGNERMMKVAL